MDERQATSRDQNSTDGSEKNRPGDWHPGPVRSHCGGIWYWHYLQVIVSTDDAQVTGDIADISPKIAGRLEKIDVSEGDVVTVGQKLAELDNAALLVSMDRRKAPWNWPRPTTTNFRTISSPPRQAPTRPARDCWRPGPGKSR